MDACGKTKDRKKKKREKSNDLEIHLDDTAPGVNNDGNTSLTEENTEKKRGKKRKQKEEVLDNDATLTSDNANTLCTEDKLEKKKKKKKKKTDDENFVDEATPTENDHTGTDEKVKKKKKRKRTAEDHVPDDVISSTKVSSNDKQSRKSEDEIPENLNANSSDISQVDVKSEKKKKKRRNEIEVSTPGGNSPLDVIRSTDEACGEKGNKKKEKGKTDKENVDSSTENALGVGHRNSGKNKHPISAVREKNKVKRMKYKEKEKMKRLLETRTNIGSEMQAKRVLSVSEEVSYNDIMDELVQKLKKNMAKKAKLQTEGKNKKIEKLDGKIKVLKNAAVEKASEKNEDAVKKLDTVVKTIYKKMKRKKRKKNSFINEIARDRQSKGQSSLAVKDGIDNLQLKTQEARSNIKQAMEKTKQQLESQLKEFTQRVEELDGDKLLAEEEGPAFSGAVFVKGYLC